MSTPEIADILNKLLVADETVKLMQQSHFDLQNIVMADNVDLNTRLLEVSAAVTTLTSQLNANASHVEDNDKKANEVIITAAGNWDNVTQYAITYRTR